MTLMMLTVTGFGFPFNPRADVRLFANPLLLEFGLAPVPPSVGLPNSSYQNLVYAGGDAVAFFKGDYTSYPITQRLVIMHDPDVRHADRRRHGRGRQHGRRRPRWNGGGTGGVPDLCPGCWFTNVPAYGRDMEPDLTRNLIYIASDITRRRTRARSSPWTTAGAVASLVPVGNDPEGWRCPTTGRRCGSPSPARNGCGA